MTWKSLHGRYQKCEIRGNRGLAFQSCVSFRLIKPLGAEPASGFILLILLLSCSKNEGYYLSRKHTERKILVPVNELEVVLVISQDCRPDPARAERDEDIV